MAIAENSLYDLLSFLIFEMFFLPFFVFHFFILLDLCVFVRIFQSLFSFFQIIRFLLITSTTINTKLTCTTTYFIIIFRLITKILLVSINLKLTCINNVFTIYFTSIPNNDITHRVVIFPWLLILFHGVQS